MMTKLSWNAISLNLVGSEELRITLRMLPVQALVKENATSRPLCNSHLLSGCFTSGFFTLALTATPSLDELLTFYTHTMNMIHISSPINVYTAILFMLFGMVISDWITLVLKILLSKLDLMTAYTVIF